MIIDRTGHHILCSLIDSDVETARAYLAGCDADRFVGFCRAHQVAGSVYTLAMALGDTEQWMSWDMIASLKESYLEQWIRNEKLLKELTRVREKTAAAGVEFVVLKGLHLAQRFYGDLDRREMHDIDILIRKPDFREGARALRACGYDSTSRYEMGERLLFAFAHHAEFRRGDVPLDLHVALRAHPALRLDDEAIWAESGECMLGGSPFRVLSDEWVLLNQLLSIHNDIKQGQTTLRAFVDLSMILRGMSDAFGWDGFLARRREDGTFKIAVNVLATFLTLFPREGRFEQATGIVRDHRASLVIPPDRDTYLRLVDGDSAGRRRAWALRQYDAPLATCLAWWTVCKPICYAVYDRAFVHRVTAGLRRRLARRRERGSPAGCRPLGVRDTASGSFDEGLLRFGSLAARFFYQRRAHVEMLEDLFRIQLAEQDDEVDASDIGAEIRMFEVTPEDAEANPWLLRKLTPGPLRPVIVRRPLEDAVTIYYHSVAAHLVRRGCLWEITVPVLSDYEDRDLLLHCVMVVFYRMLYLLERVHLHAAAVRVGGQTSLFIGQNCSGKSTISLKLGLAGGAVLGEDHVVLRRMDGRFCVSGCDGNMRLTRETEQAFFPDGLPIEPVKVGEVMKKEFRTSDRVNCAPYRDVPVDRVFFLEMGEEFRIAGMPREDAMAVVVDAVRERYRFTDDGDHEAFLGFFRGLVHSVELHRLTLSRDLADLDKLVVFLQE